MRWVGVQALAASIRSSRSGGSSKRRTYAGRPVATVARRHQLNANQVFAWRQLYRRRLLEVKPADGTSPLLAVKVSTPTVLPTERAGERAAKGARREYVPGVIEIELSNGHRVRVHGAVDAKALKRVIAVLVRR
jgi:transposase